ncbi:MAG: putative O-glycosylation ligase, exosortase A system-associated [Ectothiorhodospira sp.]
MRDLALFGIVMGLVPVILMRPWVGILGWYWVGLMSPQGLTWGFMRTFPLAVVIGGTTLVAVFLAKDRRPLPMTREMLLLGLFLAWATVTSVFAVNPDGAWDQWIKLVKILAITFVAPMLIFGERRVVPLLLVMTGSIAFYGLKGGIFAILTGGQHQVLGPARSYIEGNTYVGMAMVMILPLILATARMLHHRWLDWGIPRLQRWMRPLGWGAYATFWLTAIAILATYSRGAFLGILVIAPFLFLRMRRKGVLVALAFVLVSVVGVTVPDKLMDRWESIRNYHEDTSAMQRIQSWGVNWNMALERPLTGMGFANRNMGYDWWIQYAEFEGTWRFALSPHSTYFQLMGHHGFAGLGVYLLLIGTMLATLHRIQRTARRRTGQKWLEEYAWAVKVGLIGFLVAGAFLDMAYFELVYAFLALTVILRRELDEGVSPERAGAVVSRVEAEQHSGVPRPRFPDFVPRPQANPGVDRGV